MGRRALTTAATSPVLCGSTSITSPICASSGRPSNGGCCMVKREVVRRPWMWGATSLRKRTWGPLTKAGMYLGVCGNTVTLVSREASPYLPPSVEHLPLQVLEDLLRGLLRVVLVDLHRKVRILRGFVGAVDPGEVLDQALPGLQVVSAFISLLRGLRGGVQVDRYEVVRYPAGELPPRPVGGDKGGHHDYPVLLQHGGQVTHAPDVAVHVLGVKARLREEGAYIVAVQALHTPFALSQDPLPGEDVDKSAGGQCGPEAPGEGLGYGAFGGFEVHEVGL